MAEPTPPESPQSEPSDHLKSAPPEVKWAANRTEAPGTVKLDRQSYKAFEGLSLDQIEDLAEGRTTQQSTPTKVENIAHFVPDVSKLPPLAPLKPLDPKK